MPDAHAILQQTLAQIEAAFGDAPRPYNDDLLHERCRDDNDIARLYPVRNWREIPDELVESEYAALSFLSPDGVAAGLKPRADHCRIQAEGAAGAGSHRRAVGRSD